MDLADLTQSLWEATLETLYMVGVSTFFTMLLGLPLGVLLVITDADQILAAPRLNKVLGTIVNVGAGKDNPYANVLAVLRERQNDPNIQKLAQLLNSPEVKQFIAEKYQGAVLPAF